MKRILVAAFVTTLTTFAAYSQETPTPSISRCMLTVAQSPAIRGIRLGMSADQLLGFFPGSRDNPDVKFRLASAKQPPDYGLAVLNFISVDYKSNPLFANVHGFEIQIFDERVVDAGVSYAGPRWNSVDEMVAKVAEALHLPGSRNWMPNPNLPDTKTLKCDGFDVTVTGYRQGCCSNIHLRIPNVYQQVRDRQAAAEEKARREFKP